MASIVVTGDTSGAITIAAPAVAGTNTLTLPASTGTLVVTGGAQTIEFADGSAAAPSITNSGDTNTGMFFPAADTIAFTEGGTEVARFDANGSLLVGQTTTAVETGSIVTAKNLEITRTVDSDGAALGQLSWVNNTNAGSGSGTSFVKDVACIKGIMDGTGNNSGGYITFETKADAGSRTERMRIASDGTISTTIGSTLYGAYSARAWVNFNGTGTVAIRNSRNVSSITDNGTGDYTVNFNQAMPDAEYATAAFAAQESAVTDNNVSFAGQKGTISSNYTTSGCRLQCVRRDGNIGDLELVTAVFFR